MLKNYRCIIDDDVICDGSPALEPSHEQLKRFEE